MFSQHKEVPFTHSAANLLADFKLKLPETLFQYYEAPLVFEDDEGIKHGMRQLPVDWQGLPKFADRAQVLGTHLLQRVVNEEQAEHEMKKKREEITIPISRESDNLRT